MSDPAPVPFRTLRELEEWASAHLSSRVGAYVQGGSGDERTLAENRASFGRWTLRPRVLVDVSTIDLRSTLMGRITHAPIFVAPTAYHGQIDSDGELALARAAGGLDLLAAYSMLSSRSLEEIAAVAPRAPRWFQLYPQPETEVNQALVERAARAGYSAVVVTADAPVLGVRDRQSEGGFAIDSSVPTGNGPGIVIPPRAPQRDGPVYRVGTTPTATWETVSRIRASTRLPVLVKGILTAHDARRALEHGVRGIIVSNHGGRQLDGAPAALDALPEVVGAVGGSAEVYLDGGVRRASDVLIALALGARAVGVGRPILWALAAGGEEGVRRYLDLLLTELATSMALVGRRGVVEIDRTLVGEHPSG